MDNYNNQRVRLFVTTHKNVNRFESDVMQPVQVGLHEGSYRFPWAFHDDEGENISDRNPRYCELTTQYWAWKNVDADYYASAIIAAILISPTLLTRRIHTAKSWMTTSTPEP